MKRNRYPAHAILLVDDEQQILESCSFVLRSAGITNIIQCQDSREVMTLLSQHDIGVIVLDITMPHLTGMELLALINEDFPDTPVIILTGADELETAVSCMKSGAFDYIVKSVEENRFVTEVKRAIEVRDLIQENSSLKQHLLSDTLDHAEAFSKIITNNPGMRSLFQYVETIAKTPRPVLITGETGVGKELLARAIHTISTSSGDFIPVSVAGLDDTVFADTLFGHRKGAFPDAHRARKGLIEQATGGTLFLDEIGEMESSSQGKLLRLLQEREYHPLGSDVPRQTDARIIVATHKKITGLLDTEKLRKDLYYRLRTHQIEIPPLRKRPDDLPLLLHYFLESSACSLNKKKPTPPQELFTLLSTYHFPGNVRELESLVFDAVSRHQGGILSMEVFKQALNKEKNDPFEKEIFDVQLNRGNPLGITLQNISSENFPTLKEAEHLVLSEAMKRAQDNQTIAAHILGITRSALNKRLNRAK